MGLSDLSVHVMLRQKERERESCQRGVRETRICKRSLFWPVTRAIVFYSFRRNFYAAAASRERVKRAVLCAATLFLRRRPRSSRIRSCRPASRADERLRLHRLRAAGPRLPPEGRRTAWAGRRRRRVWTAQGRRGRCRRIRPSSQPLRGARRRTVRPARATQCLARQHEGTRTWSGPARIRELRAHGSRRCV